ncbi:MAG TPA: hypothetical protein VHS96_11820, partial [Bacteroidia bacterium]|nr:hypothetical protein [Bacteroidia bacterium]
KCHLPLPAILWHLQGLLVALDQDHVHWIGRDDTLAIANAALPWLETHPQGEAIKAAILGMPQTGKRNSRMNLVEPHDHFGPTPPRNFYRNAVEAVELSQTIAKLILAKGQKSAMIVMPEGNGLAEALAVSDQIHQILLIDLETEHLQALARAVGQSALSIDQKRKFNLLTASPLYHGSHLKGPDAVILEGLLEKLPEHHWSAMASTLFLHGQPKMVVAVEPMGKPFKAWAEAVAKEYNFQLEFQTPKISDPAKAVPLGLAIFTAHSNN